MQCAIIGGESEGPRILRRWWEVRHEETNERMKKQTDGRTAGWMDDFIQSLLLLSTREELKTLFLFKTSIYTLKGLRRSPDF